jgi:FdhD protein
MTDAAARTRSLKVTATAIAWRERVVPVEVPVALVYDGSTYAVMMASPTHLEDFAIGFSLSEGVIGAPEEISSLEVLAHDNGVELRMWLAEGRARDLVARRRQITGPTGCGLCGVESLDAVASAFAPVDSDVTFSAAEIEAALAALPAAQVLNQETHAVHGAGFWTADRGLVAIAEDVGRHNALDKLIGGLRRKGIAVSRGMILLTSRVSVEMVQKAATAGAPVVVAVSAPTGLALKVAEAAGIALVAVARKDGFEVFTHPQRIRCAGDFITTQQKEKAHHAA